MYISGAEEPALAMPPRRGWTARSAGADRSILCREARAIRPFGFSSST